MPIAVVALGISGAFVTTSMQSVSKAGTPPKIGYLRNSANKCIDTPVNCESTPNAFMCRLNYNTGPIAYDKEVPSNNCIQALYRPLN